jgi:hypothetical protein
MGDLQEIIASSSIKAFNNGYHFGRQEEQSRVIAILTQTKADFKKPISFNFLKELDILIASIKESQK